ncbi:potassium-transporting ATPase subunit C [Gordonibacter sp. An230]|uniref:potassium-transporting ATPase subunit KdpC n=1 Tax=Gordonibacter sp. An230 TaxID=1965592 RepID=UPI000B378984|nr:potassium-transporting ATPase subunit KdpC [Gordonibacter sp. An230]OUO90188.1 potassium-transporting ATPase subunit C [Gordonibacter sp. An230]
MKQAKTWGSGLLLFLVMTVITGVVYTAVCTGVAQLAFPYQANGSIIEVDGVKYGSELVGQQFTDEDHMWGRVMSPSTGTFTNNEGEDVLWYGASNLSPAGDDFAEAVQARIDEIHAAHPEKGSEPIPSDLVTNSGSGFDPHISPAAAEYQVERLAKNTGKSEDEIRAIIEKCTEQPQLGILGDARVNVLKVNLMLDGILPVE